MSRFTDYQTLIARPFSYRALLAVLALALVAMTAAPAQALQPEIRRVRGIDHGAAINGWVTIGAWVKGDPQKVVFSLSGPISRTTVRKANPYFFLTNREGRPRAWNTSRAPEGNYVLRVKAVKDGQIADSLTVRFRIDHGAVKQNTLPRELKAKTALKRSKASSSTAASSSDKTINTKPSAGPAIAFAADAHDTHERHSGGSIGVEVNGQMPGDADILAIAWDDDRRQIVGAFAHQLDKNHPVITPDKLDLLPDGRMQLQLLYRERSVVKYKKMHWVNVVTPAQSGTGALDEPQAVPAEPAIISGVSGLGSSGVLAGGVKIEANISGGTPDEVVFIVDGPQELIHTARSAPYVFLGGVWSTSKHPNGRYSITISAMVGGEQTDSKTFNFNIENEVITPDPVVAFPSDTPSTYTQGEGIGIPFTVDGTMPDNGTVLVLAWSSATWGMVDSFAHYKPQGPWEISAQKLALLPPGRTQLQLLYRVDNKTVYKRTHELKILGAVIDEPVVDSGSTGGDTSTDSGNNGSVNDTTTTTGGTNGGPDTGGSTADNSGTGGGDTGGSTGSGSNTGTGTGGSTADSGDTASTPPPPPPDSVVTQGQQPVLGMNLSFVTYWTREWVFTNVMRQAKGWISTNTGGQPWDNGGNVATNSEGWPLLNPGQAAATLILNATDGHYPGGRYICTFDGDGDVVLDFDAKVTSRQPGHLEANVTPSNNGIYLRIENSNLSNPVRNVKLVHESLVDHPSSFHPLFVERLKPFKTLRFMDWQRTNTTTQVNWSDRNTPENATQANRDGVAIELMIELANELGADPWFCMPAQANDDYVRRFAQLVKDRLHTNGKVYVEWSNEVWNTQFEVHKWIKAETDNRSLSHPFYDKWSAEAKRDFAIWTDVWGNQSNRVVRVAASQAALVYATEQLTKRMNGQFDAISCSTYFALGSREERAMSSSTSADDIIAALEENIVTNNRRYYTEHGDLARRWSTEFGRPIKLIAYEGGQHLADGGQNKPHKNALIAAQDHPKMYDLYIQNMFEFEKAGGSANVMFNYVGGRNQWGSWGHLRYQDQPTDQSLKFKAMLDYPGSQKRLELSTFD